MTKQAVLIPLVALVLIIGACAFGTRVSAPNPVAVGGSGGFTFDGNITNSKATVFSTSTSILASNPTRAYAALVNDGASVVYLSLGSLATSTQGIRLNASGGAYEINQTNLYLGPITAITSSGTSTLTIVEK